jgi:hypothetical protein
VAEDAIDVSLVKRQESDQLPQAELVGRMLALESQVGSRRDRLFKLLTILGGLSHR